MRKHDHIFIPLALFQFEMQLSAFLNLEAFVEQNKFHFPSLFTIFKHV